MGRISNYLSIDIDYLLLKMRLRSMHFYYRINNIVPLHVLHIGKTGGTAIKHALNSIRSFDRYNFVLHPHKVTLKDIPKGEKVIFFLRDPIKRFVSAFNSRLRKGLPRYEIPWSQSETIAFADFGSANELAMGLSGNDAVRSRAVFAMNNIRHVKDSFWLWFKNETYFRSRFDDVFLLGRQESLNEDFEKLKIKLGLPGDLCLPNDAFNAHKSPLNISTHLNEQAICNLAGWYKRDYEFIKLCQSLTDQTK